MKNEHVKAIDTNSELLFVPIMDRLRVVLDLSSDAELSRALGLSTSNFSNRKAANSLPFEPIVRLCLERSISLDWLFSGQGKRFTNNEQSKLTVFVKPVEPFLLGEIMAELGYSQSPDFNPALEGWKTDYGASTKYAEDNFLGMLAATIYDKIGHLPDGKKRRTALHREVTRLGEPLRLYTMQREASRRQNDD